MTSQEKYLNKKTITNVKTFLLSIFLEQKVALTIEERFHFTKEGGIEKLPALRISQKCKALLDSIEVIDANP